MTAAEKSHAEKIITLEITRSPNNITRIGPRLSNVHLSHLPREGREEGGREGCFIKRFHVLINDPLLTDSRALNERDILVQSR